MARINPKTARNAVIAVMATLGIGSGSWLYYAAPKVTDYEALYTHTYRDIVGVSTYCIGETENVQRGKTYTVEECAKLLVQKLPRYNAEINKCLKVDPPAKVRASFVSLAYNVGSGAFCRSTVMRKANAGDYAGACKAMLAFNRAGGRVVQGLVNRRADEYRLCMEGAREFASIDPRSSTPARYDAMREGARCV